MAGGVSLVINPHLEQDVRVRTTFLPDRLLAHVPELSKEDIVKRELHGGGHLADGAILLRNGRDAHRHEGDDYGEKKRDVTHDFGGLGGREISARWIVIQRVSLFILNTTSVKEQQAKLSGPF